MPIPQDLINAIWSARRQYSPVHIKETEGFLNESGLITFIPKSPEADETWELGGSISFRINDELSLKAEITSFDPSTGEIYVKGGSELKDLEDLAGISLYYEPFDFAKVLDEAYKRIGADPRLLEILKLAHLGTSDVPEKTKVGVTQMDPSLGTIKNIWAKRWALLWGPPGTGKTKCLVDALAAYTSIGEQGKIIVLTPTNKATDEVARRTCELLKKRGDLRPGALCPVFRGGKGVGKDLADSHKECLGDVKYAKAFQDILNKIAELERKRDAARLGGNRSLFHSLQSEIKALRGSLPDETEWVIKNGFAQIIVLTTYKGLTLVGKDLGPIYKVIVDEAGMVSRAVTAAVSVLGDTVLLAGDPKQIGPIYLQEKGVTRESSRWMAKSGLSHLEAGAELLTLDNVLFLDKQYRMHPDISKVVSHFTYNKLLKDADGVKDLPASSQAFPSARAIPVILNSVTQASEHLCASKAKKGRGFERDYSAKVAVDLAGEACAGGDTVLILTPYRAQARLIRSKLEEIKLSKKVGVGTIHKYQGAERDVVILDTVKGCHPWHASDVKILLNVSASRAKKHFFMISSMEEVLGNPLLYELATLMGQQEFSLTAYDKHGQGSIFSYAPIEVKRPKTLIEYIAPNVPTDSLGAEINSGIKLVLISQEQSKLIEKPLREGHYLVRGVAGSGKSLILANWAISALKKNPNIKILITYYNKGLKSLLDCMLSDSRLRYEFNTLQDRITVVNINKVDVSNRDRGEFDIVFVDEAQDFDPGQLESAYLCAKPFQKDGKEERNLVVFHDDSQNIYGRQILEDFKLSFQGRASVLREAYRSTRAILEFAINMALDPKKLYTQGDSHLLEYFKINELAKEGLLIRPEDSERGIYEVRYTDVPGISPFVRAYPKEEIFNKLAEEIQKLIKEEHVKPGNIMVVTITRPSRARDALRQLGILAEEYSGDRNADFPASGIAHVRCTHVFSCKGHEAPIVFFADVNNLETFIPGMQGIMPNQHGKIARCMLYVGITRAMVRLYLYGTQGTKLMAAAEKYSQM